MRKVLLVFASLGVLLASNPCSNDVQAIRARLMEIHDSLDESTLNDLRTTVRAAYEKGNAGDIETCEKMLKPVKEKYLSSHHQAGSSEDAENEQGDS